MKIRYPWPDPKLSPNKRYRREWLTTVRQQAREVGFYITKDARLSVPKDTPLEMSLLLCPPNLQQRDDDNVLSAFKSTRDGIFDALEVNDRFVRRTVLEWGSPEEDGAVYVEIKPIANGG